MLKYQLATIELIKMSPRSFKQKTLMIDHVILALLNVQDFGRNLISIHEKYEVQAYF